jgi:hypothetical protein
MKQRRRVNGTDVTQPVPPRSGLVQLLSEPTWQRELPVSLSRRRLGQNGQIICNIHQLADLCQR